MTTTITVSPHAVKPNNGVEITVLGEGETKTFFVPNGDSFDIAIHGNQRFYTREATGPAGETDATHRDGSVTARSFNPSNNPTVDGIKGLVEMTASYIEDEVPAGRRRSIALTHLETASMYAVKANFYPEG